MTKENRTRNIQLAILIVLGSLTILMLVLPELSDLSPNPEPLEVTILIRGNDSTLWNNARLGMEQAAYDMGADLRFLTPSQNNSGEEQHELILRELERGSDAVVVVPADSDALARILIETEVSVPVVSMESLIEPDFPGVLPDNEKLGALLAQTVIEDLPKSSTVLLLDTAPNSIGVSRRLTAAADTLSQAGLDTVVYRLTSESVTAPLSQLVEQHKIMAVMAFDSAATQAAAREMTDIPSPPALYGVGATNLIIGALERETVTAVAVWNEYAGGYLAVQQAIRAASGLPVERKMLDFSIVRGEDVYELDTQKLLFPVTG